MQKTNIIKTNMIVLVFILMMSASVFAITGTGQDTSLLLISDFGHLGANITTSGTSNIDVDSRKTWNRVQGAYGPANTYTVNNATVYSGRYWELSKDVFSPVITGAVSSSDVKVRQATITWSTDEVSTSVINYGTATDALTSSSSSSALTTVHTITLLGLAQRTTYYYNVTSCDRYSFCRNSGTYTFTTQTEAEEAIGGSGGGGGGGTTKTTQGYSIARTFNVVPANQMVQMNIVSEHIAFTKIAFKLSKTAEKAKIEVLRYNPKIPNAPEIKNPVYEYLKVDHANIKDEDILSTIVTFTVTNDWLKSNKLNTENIVLLRLEGNNWVELPTKKLAEGGLSATYESTFKGMSYFAIVGKDSKGAQVVSEAPKEEKEEVEEQKAEEPTTKEETPVTGAVTGEEKVTPPKVEKETNLWVGVIIFVVLLIIGYLIYRKLEK